MPFAVAAQHQRSPIWRSSSRSSAASHTRIIVTTAGARGGSSLFQQRDRAVGRRELLEGALARRFVGAPADRPRAVADASAGDLIERDLEHELVLELHVAAVAFFAAVPTAGRAVGRAAGEARFADVRLQARQQRLLLGRRERAAEPDVVEQPRVVVHAEQERTDLRGRAFGEPKPADDAVRRAGPLNLYRGVGL